MYFFDVFYEFNDCCVELSWVFMMFFVLMSGKVFVRDVC